MGSRFGWPPVVATDESTAFADYLRLAPDVPIQHRLPPALEHAASERNRWIQQMRRRAGILANARRLLADQGYEHVAVRQLAAESGVTPPTIYNLVGGRDEVIRRAVSESHAAKVAFATERAAIENVNPLLAYADTLWITLYQKPGYTRQAIRLVFDHSHDEKLSRLVRDAVKAAILTWLTSLDEGGRVRRHANLPLLAEQADRHIERAIAAWSYDDCDVLDLRRDLAMGVGLMLLGIVDTTEAARIEAWLARPGLDILTGGVERPVAH